MLHVHNQKTILGYTMMNISSPWTCVVFWWMPMSNSIRLSIQRIPHFISAHAVYDISVMERFDADMPCGARLPLWHNAINGLPSQEEESNCSFCRYSTLWPSHYLIIYMSFWWAFPMNGTAILKYDEEFEKLSPFSPVRCLWKCTEWIFFFIF